MARLCLNIFLVVAGQKWVWCSIPDSWFIYSVYLKQGGYRSLDSSYTLLSSSSLTRPILVVHLKGPTQLLLRRPTGRHIRGHHELLEQSNSYHHQVKSSKYLEVYAAITVLVKYPEYLVHEDLSIASRKYHGVHLQDFIFAKLTVRAVLFESSGKW